jgi:hypothetical protein
VISQFGKDLKIEYILYVIFSEEVHCGKQPKENLFKNYNLLDPIEQGAEKI